MGLFILKIFMEIAPQNSKKNQKFRYTKNADGLYLIRSAKYQQKSKIS